MTDATPGPFFSREERFALVPSTNDVVRGWLRDGTPEVCLALADEQSAGRGRQGRTWQAPRGAALLLSVGFRPSWLAADRTWRLAATVSLAMADAAEEVAGLPDRAIRLKWPNDLVIETAGPKALLLGEIETDAAAARLAGPVAIRKLGGVLGETDGLGTADPMAVVGIGINAEWPARDFPPDLAATMTSLHEASAGRPIDRILLLDAFSSKLESRILALRSGWFDVHDWIDRQVTTGRSIRLEEPGGRSSTVTAVGLDAGSGGLVVADPVAPAGERIVLSGEVVKLRLADPAGVTA